jgi:hypothetical protein
LFPFLSQNKVKTMDVLLLTHDHVNEEDRLESLLQRRLGNRVRDLRVQFLAGGLLLQGRASTYHAKQLAQHAAMEMSALPIVANDIEVF